MSRVRRFVHGVASGYVAMAANIVTSLIAVPIALHFLTKDAFGLWALLTQVVNYMMLIDLGMTASVARLLIERKDAADDRGYARLIHTGLAVSVAQGAIVIVLGCALAPWLAAIFKIPAHSHHVFLSLVRWQSLIAGGTFAVRIYRNILFAHQRLDLINYIQTAGFCVYILTLAIWLYAGYGVMSVIWSNACVLIFTAFANWSACARLKILPKANTAVQIAGAEFRELFAYGGDVFVVQLGSLLIVTTQPMILSRCIGPEAVAIWAVGSKAFTMLTSLIYQVFDISAPAFAEMMMRQEKDRLLKRYREIVLVSVAVAAVAAVDYAVLNTSFVETWTHGKIQWSLSNDILLGIWLIISVLIHANSGFIVLTKKIGSLRYIYLLEGVAFVCFSPYLTRHYGIPGLISASLVCSVLLSGAYGLRRISQYFGGLFTADTHWLSIPAKLLAFLIPAACVFWFATTNLPALYRFLIGATLLGAFAVFIFLRYGIPASLRPDILARIPPSFRREIEKWAVLEL